MVIAGQSNSLNLYGHLAYELDKSGLAINVFDGGVGGTCLIDRATADVKGNCWLYTGEGSSLLLPKLLERIERRHFEISLVWWIQGENEALFAPVTEQEYLDALITLRERMGCVNVPFMVSPIAGLPTKFIYARPVIAAQYRAAYEHGFILGPEYYDLLTPGGDEHIESAGQIEFCKRAARIIVSILKGSAC